MIRKIKIAIYTIITLLIVGCIFWVIRSIKTTSVSISADERIDITPEQITSIKSIGEWEFLSIANEELVDTTRKGFFSDDHLVRIYYGTIRLGINLHQLEPGWFTKKSEDSILITLPPIGLLDKDFIDEARTKSFYETGKWSHKDREALYNKAYQQMINHSLTTENLQHAKENGEGLFLRMMKSMGYQHVCIHFTEAAK